MKDEYEGKDLDEAIGQASADLGIPEDELHYEVLEQGRKGLLGLGMKNVRIRVMRPVEHLTDREILHGEEPAGARAEVEAVAEVPAPESPEGEATAATPKGEGGRKTRPRRRRRRSRRPGGRRSEAAGAESPGGAEAGEGSGSDGGSPTDAGERSEKPRRRRRSRRRGRARGAARQEGRGFDDEDRLDGAEGPEVDETPVEPLTGQPLEVQQTLERIFELSDLQIEVRPGRADSGIALRLGGADRRLLRQRNSELLHALQLLLNRMARRAWPEVGRIHLTTNGDHKSRDSKLVELTRGAADEVTRTGRTKMLRPMNAYERRLVHLTIREYSGLTSSSDGSGAVKRVRISKVQNTMNM